jgi:hypothetical protein
LLFYVEVWTMILETGCYIDCSHLSSDELNYRIIKFTTEYGWEGGSIDTAMLINDYLCAPEPDNDGAWTYEDAFELSETLYYAAEDAVQWLNDNKFGPDNVYWTVEDNSLYLWEDENEDL